MTWNFDFEIYSAIIIAIVMIYYFKGTRVPTWQNRSYSAILVCAFLFVIINITATLSLSHISSIPLDLVYFLNLLYYIFLPMMSMLVLLFVVSLVHQEFFSQKSKVVLMLTPYIICVVLALTNNFTHILFSLTKEAGYVRGPYSIAISYGCFALYAVSIFVFTLLHNKEIKTDKTVAIYGFLIISAISVAFQMVLEGYMFTGMASASSILLIHLSMQNESIVIDELTGAFKRQVLVEMIELRFKKAENCELITIGLRDFKFANEIFGTKTCDQLLTAVATYLKSQASTGRVYRFDGDVFIIAAYKKSKLSVEQILDNITDRFKISWNINGLDYKLSSYLTVLQIINENLKSVEDIVSALDFALHEAKNHGDGWVVRGDEIFTDRFKKKNRLKSMMAYALDHDGFEVHYQPIYSIPLKRYATSEALVRMSDPEFGMISPAEFIPMAEENGMIIDIGLTVFEKVCRFVAENPYEKAGFETVGVNLSVVQCMQENLADDLIAVMERYQIDPSRIKLEITETVAAVSLGTLQQTMTRLIDYGCSFALDDFGIGYASMSNMLTLPLKLIKLDKSLIERMVENEHMKMAVECIIGLIHRLNMRVVAEGVEVSEELEILKSLSCDFIQGYYFSKPLPEESFKNLVREAAEKSNVQN